ncbi:MAG: RluA family pseudouridine synthase [Candidatus Vogelbacteria bacterium]|nr:RluA family pseudouridine synthase [Candidatus Vogelbacteria bacterium]
MLEPKIIFEDEGILVLDKPAGIKVHRDDFTGESETTLADWLLKNYPNLAEVGEVFTSSSGQVFSKPGIVHRLDNETSGVLLVAKTFESYLFLKSQFKNHTITKTYHALVYGNFNDWKVGESRTVDVPLGRSSSDPRQRVASVKANGPLREAKTEFTLLENLSDYSYLAAKPVTGRTHQIRAHLKYLQHPVVCDQLYARGAVCPPPLARQALHALQLELEWPKGQRSTFTASLPGDFKTTLDHLRQP